jgi:hypothetical protein
MGEVDAGPGIFRQFLVGAELGSVVECEGADGSDLSKDGFELAPHALLPFCPEFSERDVFGLSIDDREYVSARAVPHDEISSAIPEA